MTEYTSHHKLAPSIEHLYIRKHKLYFHFRITFHLYIPHHVI
jgi:hypothetical protein